VRAEALAKRGVYEMRRRVIPPGRIALLGIDDRSHLVADLDRAALYLRFVKYQSRQRCERVEHAYTREVIGGRRSVVSFFLIAAHCPLTPQKSRVSDLSARLRVVWRVFQN